MLRHAPFAYFCAGSFLSTTGIHLTTVALAWQVYDLTGSALSVGFIGVSQGVPQVLVTLFGGALADAFDRRRLMMAIQWANILFSVLLVGFSATAAVTAPMLVGFSALFAATNALETPSRQAIVTNILPVELVPSGIALSNTLRNLAITVGPALAGLVLALGGPTWCYALDLVSWLAMLGALAVLRLRPDVPVRPSFAAVVEGGKFVAAQPVILAFIVLDFGATFFGTATALFPIYAREILRVGEAGLGLLYAAPSLGAVLAGVLLTIVSGRKATGRLILAGVAVYALATIGFGLSRTFWLSVVLLVCVGAGNAVSATLRQSSIQLLTPGHLRGRVSAVTSVFWGGQWGQLESGVAAQIGGAQFSAVSGGAGALLFALAVYCLPVVRRFSIDPAEERTSAG